MSGKPETIAAEPEQPGLHQSPSAAGHWGWRFLIACVILFAAVTIPVIVDGTPMLDDFGRCVDPQRAGYWASHWQLQGVFRPATTIEIGVVNTLCRIVPFGFLMLLPWLLTLAVAFLTRALLGDLGVPSPWREIGAGLWLLAPLGTETALRPATVHVTLGLCLVLMALRSFLRGRIVLGAMLGLASYLSVEQVILALPLAAFLVSPREKRVPALLSTAVLSMGVALAYSLWGGTTFGLAVSLPERLQNAIREPEEYVILPAIGLGVHSIPTAVAWAFPISALSLAVGCAIGATFGPRILRSVQPTAKRIGLGFVLGSVVLVGLINAPVAFDYPHQHSPRIFAPTWLALVVLAAIAGSRARWRRPRLVGAIAGTLIAGAVLSLALSSWVRVRSSALVERAMYRIAAETPDEGVVAICGRTRTLVVPAPYGDFSVHEFMARPAEAYEYYTGKTAEIRLGGYAAPSRCPELEGADVVFEFQELVGS